MHTTSDTARPDPGSARFVRWFDTLSGDDLARVGGKNASIGELARLFDGRGAVVPDGFALTTDACRAFLREAGIDLAQADSGGEFPADSLAECRRRVLEAPVPARLEEEIHAAYLELSRHHGGSATDVAVRSSVVARHAPDASFADHFDSYLGLSGCAEILHACRRCLASVFTERVSVRLARAGLTVGDLSLSVGIQKMIRSDLGRGASGIVFHRPGGPLAQDAVVVLASYGLGECIVRGSVSPDEFRVLAPAHPDGNPDPLIEATLGAKDIKMVHSGPHGSLPRAIPVPASDRNRLSLSPSQVLQLARWSTEVEAHYGRPMILEWALDGESERLFLLQARPGAAAPNRIRRTFRPVTPPDPVPTGTAAVGAA